LSDSIIVCSKIFVYDIIGVAYTDSSQHLRELYDNVRLSIPITRMNLS